MADAHSCAGFDLLRSTPLPTLWYVGDAMKDHVYGGTQVCALTAKLAAEHLMRWLDGEPAQFQQRAAKRATR